MKHAFGLLVSAAALALGSAAWADCGIEKGSVRILSNDFPALGAVNSAAEQCASPTVTVTRNQTAEHQSLQGPALTVNPATYTVAVVANDSVVPLLNAGLIRPLDDLVAKHGQGLQDSQLIRIDGKIMAIAFMIRNKGLLENPLAAGYKPGWDLGAEFINMYTGLKGELFEPGGAAAAIENEQGVEALAMMKALSVYMSRDFVTYNTNALQSLWESGETAIMNGWGSRAAAVLDENAPEPAVAAATTFAAAPTVGGGTVPAATLWWDGFTIARNISDEDAEASFRAMVHAIGPETAQAHPTEAAWLIEGYQPTPAAQGVFETLKAGAKPYPIVPTMGLLHTALGNNLIEFLQGSESAEQALADATKAYETAAKEAGFLN